MILERVGKTTMVTENKLPMYCMKIGQGLQETCTIGWLRHMLTVFLTNQTTRRPTPISMITERSSSQIYTTLRTTQEGQSTSNRWSQVKFSISMMQINNKSIQSVLSMSPQDMISRNNSSCIHPASKEEVTAQIPIAAPRGTLFAPQLLKNQINLLRLLPIQIRLKLQLAAKR